MGSMMNAFNTSILSYPPPTYLLIRLIIATRWTTVYLPLFTCRVSPLPIVLVTFLTIPHLPGHRLTFLLACITFSISDQLLCHPFAQMLECLIAGGEVLSV